MENWKNRLHEVSMRKCVRIASFVRRVEAQSRELPTYEGLPNLATFLSEFEGLVIAPQCLSVLNYVLKATPAKWWGTIRNLYHNGHSVEYCWKLDSEKNSLS